MEKKTSHKSKGKGMGNNSSGSERYKKYLPLKLRGNEGVTFLKINNHV
jgi:hypothetical protein